MSEEEKKQQNNKIYNSLILNSGMEREKREENPNNLERIGQEEQVREERGTEQFNPMAVRYMQSVLNRERKSISCGCDYCERFVG